MTVTSRSIELGDVGVLVHGGAGPRAPSGRDSGCREAATAGHAVLAAGGTALDAVERAVRVLEDDPRYNAGTGAVLTEEGGVELDAAIMDGLGLRAGAVAGLVGIADPISVARAVLEDGRHVFYAGEGAARFARSKGFAFVDPAALITEESRAALRRFLASHPSPSGPQGTVGAVARDRHGNVAAATSTGGTTGKRSGRIGDSPVLGAGTYADNALGAVSATGHGEGILRVALASRLLQASLTSGAESAARDAMADMEARVGSTGGVLVVSHAGHFAWARTTESMPWALHGSRGLESGE